MSGWTEEERDDLCDALSKYSTKRALSDVARVDIVIRAVDRIMAARRMSDDDFEVVAAIRRHERRTGRKLSAS